MLLSVLCTFNPLPKRGKILFYKLGQNDPRGLLTNQIIWVLFVGSGHAGRFPVQIVCQLLPITLLAPPTTPVLLVPLLTCINSPGSVVQLAMWAPLNPSTGGIPATLSRHFVWMR